MRSARATSTRSSRPWATDRRLHYGKPPGQIPTPAFSLGHLPAFDAAAIGSVKTLTGHLESAAGIAGLIKTTLAMHHGLLPANLNYAKPSPHIPFDKLNIEVATVWIVSHSSSGIGPGHQNRGPRLSRFNPDAAPSPHPRPSPTTANTPLTPHPKIPRGARGKSFPPAPCLHTPSLFRIRALCRATPGTARLGNTKNWLLRSGCAVIGGLRLSPRTGVGWVSALHNERLCFGCCDGRDVAYSATEPETCRV